MNMDLDNFRAVYDRRVLRFLIGAEGKFDALDTAWKWDGYLSIGQTFGSLISLHAIDQPRYRLAVDAVRAPNGAIVCRSTLTNPTNGCVPYNMFGIGVNSKAAIDYLQGRYGFVNNRLNQKVAAFSVSGDPFSTWAGPVNVAVGVEYRTDKIDGDADAISQARGFQTNSASLIAGKVAVDEAYLETLVPLANGLPFAEVA